MDARCVRAMRAGLAMMLSDRSKVESAEFWCCLFSLHTISLGSLQLRVARTQQQDVGYE